MASTKQVATLLPKLATDLPGCGEADKLAALQRWLLEFCRRSRVWRVDLGVSMAANSLVASLDWPCEAVAIAINQLKYDGVVMPFGNSSSYQASLGVASNGKQTLTLNYSPIVDVVWMLTISGVLIPSAPSYEVSDWIIDRYGDVIVDGAMATLKMHARKSYSDPAGAAAATAAYRRGVAYACLDGARTVGRGL